MLKLNNVTKIYQTKSKENVIALNKIKLSFDKKGLVFVIGASGSGKTTLLNVIGGLDDIDEGVICINEHILGKDISLEKYRQNYVGFVFQEYNLLENLSVFENIAIAVSACEKIELQDKINRVLDEVGLSGFAKRRINELSGGQKQRVAIARALAKNSSILLCDEPTGNLDRNTSIEIFDLLKKFSSNKIVIVVSHNEELAKQYAVQLIKISDGEIIENSNILTTIETLTVNTNTANKVPLKHKIKLGFRNLFTNKFKTFVSFLLLFLSLLAMCASQLCLTYNAERSISKTLKDKSTIIVYRDDPVTPMKNSKDEYPIGYDLSNYLSGDKYFNGYTSIYGIIFIINDSNINRDFYFREDLVDGTAYVPDYFIDISNNLDDNYMKLTYNDYDDLLGQEVVYNDNVIFKIAGIFKTDYKEYIDERGHTIESKLNDFDDEYVYKRTLMNKINLEYKSIYTNLNTFNNMYIGSYIPDYDQERGYKIQVVEDDYKTSLSNIAIIDKLSDFEYFDNSGRIKRFFPKTIAIGDEIGIIISSEPISTGIFFH